MAKTATKLTKKQDAVVRAYAAKHGRHWKNRLHHGWETKNFRFAGTDDEIHTLNGLRYVKDAWDVLDAVKLD
jgi:hypothetical protein